MTAPVSGCWRTGRTRIRVRETTCGADEFHIPSPERHDQQDHRRAKGSKGGRPPRFDAAAYAQRNTVERGFLRLKHWRGIATRYDKHALTFLGGITLATTLIHLRTN